MKSPALHPALIAMALAVMPASAQDLAVASAAFQDNDLPTVIGLLLGAEESGRLDDTEALMQLALACEQARIPPRNKRHPCSKRAADIMVKAAERGDPRAMFAASIGLMNTGAGRIGLALPFVDDNKRVNALMWAALAANFAMDDTLRHRASRRATELARQLHGEWRGQESLAQRAMQLAESRRQAFVAAGVPAYQPAAEREQAGEMDVADDMGEIEDPEFDVPRLEDRNAITCGGVVAAGSDVTVRFGPKRAQHDAYDFGVIRQDDGQLFYLSSDALPPAHQFIAHTRFRESPEITIPTSVRAPTNPGQPQHSAPVFTIPGRYSFYISPAFDSHEGGFICTIEYAP